MPRLHFALAVLLALAACSKAPPASTDLDGLDRELTDANARDPALTAALADQIMVDPALTQSSNANAVRPPSRPDGGAVPAVDIAAVEDGVDPAGLRHAPPAGGDCPECRAAEGALTLGALAGRQGAPMAACAGSVRYSAAWATRLPADLPLYPAASVTEAAGADGDGCRLRVVSFASAAPAARLIDWYYTRATAAGYSAGHRAGGTHQVLAGRRGTDAYILYVRPRTGGGSEADLVAGGG